MSCMQTIRSVNIIQILPVLKISSMCSNIRNLEEALDEEDTFFWPPVFFRNLAGISLMEVIFPGCFRMISAATL